MIIGAAINTGLTLSRIFRYLVHPLLKGIYRFPIGPNEKILGDKRDHISYKICNNEITACHVCLLLLNVNFYSGLFAVGHGRCAERDS